MLIYVHNSIFSRWIKKTHLAIKVAELTIKVTASIWSVGTEIYSKQETYEREENTHF